MIKYLFPFLLALLPGSLLSQVTQIYTDYDNFWTSSTTNINLVKPDNSHHLLAFRYNGTVYSTGVDDPLLTSEGVTFATGNFRALPFENLPMTGGTTYFVGLGQMSDGIHNGGDNSATTPFPANSPSSVISSFLTRGIRGLDLGTGLANIPSGTSVELTLSASGISLAAISDAIPDIIVSQIAAPIASNIDQIRFVDELGNTVGNAVNFDISTEAVLGNWDVDFYNLSSTLQATFTNTERPIRLKAYLLSDFGLNSGNYTQAKKLIYAPGGSSDPAFIAFNEPSIGIATKLAVTAQPLTYQHDTNFGTNITVEVQDGAGQIVEAAGIVITASISSGDGTLLGTLTATTNASGVATFSNLRIQGIGTHVLRFENSSLDPALSANIDCAAMSLSTTLPAGSGTPGAPYLIESLENLYWIAANSSRWTHHYRQIAHIDASETAFWECGEGWSPIGTTLSPFSGSYDGGGHLITGLHIDADLNGMGFFGVTNGLEGEVVIQNLGLVSVNFTNAASSRTGALVGWHQQGIVRFVYANGQVAAQLGGLCNLGGLIGELGSDFGMPIARLENSYARTDVSTSHAFSTVAGGLVGRIQAASVVDKCYSAGLVSSVSGMGHGGLIGSNGGTVTDSYWDNMVSGQASSAGGTSQTTTEMKDINNFFDAQWDLACERVNGNDDFWGLSLDNDGYPWLQWEGYDAQCPEWTGNDSDTWSINTNWIGNLIARDGMDVIIHHAAVRPLQLQQSQVIGHLIFNSSSTLVELGPYNLTIQGDITGAGTGSYIQTNGNGKVIRDIPQGSSFFFPVGQSSYTPLTLANFGDGDTYSVRVADFVFTEASSGSQILDRVVDRTWFIEEDVPGGSDLTATFHWSVNEELGNFDRSESQLRYYYSSVWNSEGPKGPAVGSNPYSFTVSGIASLSPFAIGDDQSAFPVEWLSFEATAQQGQVRLDWQTASEQNSHYFAVERSSDGLGWATLGQVSAAGHSDVTRSYQFLDSKPLSGLQYYRLRQVDFDGRHGYSDVRSVNLEATLSVYPNPVRDLLYLDLPGNGWRGELLDAQGRSLQQHAHLSQTLDFSALPAGIYLLRLEGPEGQRWSTPLRKE